MAGIYIHVPYCRQKCSYCNFYFSVSGKTKEGYLKSLIKEIEITKEFLQGNEIKSLYFGGGTPSILSSVELSLLIDKIKHYYSFSDDIEITLEANPDDINKNYADEIVKLGINRLSIGVQSFHDNELTLLKRNHLSQKALESIITAKNNGINNLSIDLIFGIPGSNINLWLENLNRFIELDIDHLSCYNLTVEKKTDLDYRIQKGIVNEIVENLSVEMFLTTIEFLSEHGYEHYEISNYARNKKYAIHNTNYWKGEKYLGLGPSAHSFDGKNRYWNISNVRKYIESIENGISPNESEKLTENEKYNEYIMTGLRTMWGIDDIVINSFGQKNYSLFKQTVEDFINQDLILKNNDNYKLSDKGKLYADRIASELFLD